MQTTESKAVKHVMRFGRLTYTESGKPKLEVRGTINATFPAEYSEIESWHEVFYGTYKNTPLAVKRPARRIDGLETVARPVMTGAEILADCTANSYATDATIALLAEEAAAYVRPAAASAA